MVDNLDTLCADAASIVSSFPKHTLVRVISHYDADGISAAAVLCRALYRAGYDFHTSLMRNPFDKGLKRVLQEENDLVLFSDMGSGQIETLEKFSCKVVVFDHHQVVKSDVADNILQVNANLCGMDGNYEVSGATLAFAFAHTLDSHNVDLSALALSGAVGDKQHIGGFKGYNKKVLDQAIQQGFLQERTRIKLHGETIREALYDSIDPYYPKLSGDKQAVETLLDQLDIKNQCSPEDLNGDALIRLQSYLLFKLIQAGCQKEILDIAIRKRYFAPDLGCELERFADLLDACGKNGYRGLGLSLCLMDTKELSEAYKVEKDYKQKILDGLHKLDQGEVTELKGLRYFQSTSSSLGGVIAGIAMNYLMDQSKPLFSFAKKDNELHVSARGSQPLVRNGLDLGGALKQVTQHLNGFGGGHKIAAGATIALEKEEEFIKKVDELLVKQLKG
jgi:RecJ-like exonuclease